MMKIRSFFINGVFWFLVLHLLLAMFLYAVMLTVPFSGEIVVSHPVKYNFVKSFGLISFFLLLVFTFLPIHRFKKQFFSKILSDQTIIYFGLFVVEIYGLMIF